MNKNGKDLAECTETIISIICGAITIGAFITIVVCCMLYGCSTQLAFAKTTQQRDSIQTKAKEICEINPFIPLIINSDKSLSDRLLYYTFY